MRTKGIGPGGDVSSANATRKVNHLFANRSVAKGVPTEQIGAGVELGRGACGPN